MIAGELWRPAIWRSRLEVFRDAGHGVFRDRSDEALTVIRDFVRIPDAKE